MTRIVRLTLLMLEDDPAVYKFVPRVLENRGVTVVVVHTLSAVAKHLGKNRWPDVFLFDLSLRFAAQDGYEFALELIERHGIPPSKFFFLSAHTDKFDIPTEFSTHHIFSKPLRDFDRLAERLHDASGLRGEGLT